MKITLDQFSRCPIPQPVTIRSVDMVGYQANVIMDGIDYRLVDKSGKTIRHHSLMHMRKALQTMPVASITLIHQSAYDEMINQPIRQQDNTLELPLSLDLYPEISDT